MKTISCHAGPARRSDTYQHLEASSRGACAPGVTTAAVTGLIARAVKVLCPALSPAAVHLLILLVEHVHGDEKWRQGRLRVIPSNARLAMMLGTCERRVRSLLALLEANHWIIRRYTEANRRNRPEAGMDLAPVAAPLDRLAAAVGIFVRETGLSGNVWAQGVARHGWAALGAAVVTMERQGVTRKPGYLRTMLRHSRLPDTVRHSLRQLLRGALRWSRTSLRGWR